MRFLRHGGIYRSDEASVSPRRGRRLPLVGAQAPVKGATEGARLGSSSAMSSGRLFLDRGARQHCPSPLHRRFHDPPNLGAATTNLHQTVNCLKFVCLTRGVQSAKLTGDHDADCTVSSGKKRPPIG